MINSISTRIRLRNTTSLKYGNHISLLVILLPIVLSGCAETNQLSMQKTAASTSSQIKTISYNDPFYEPLKGIDLSRYRRTDDGLVLIGTKGDFDLLLTEPGKSYKITNEMKGFSYKLLMPDSKTEINPSGMWWDSSPPYKFSGYLLRWHKNEEDLLPYIGRLTTHARTGQTISVAGNFNFVIYGKSIFHSDIPTTLYLADGLITNKSPTGQILSKHYDVEISWNYELVGGIDVVGVHRENTTRPVKTKSPGNPKSPTFDYFASALPQYEFHLPRPGTLMSLASWNESKDAEKGTTRNLYMREYSLKRVLSERKINPRDLVLNSIDFRHAGYSKDYHKSFQRAWVDAGESAFLYSYITNKTYLLTQGDNTPVLTLPSLKEISANVRLSVNQQCMGKTEGIAVLTGNCSSTSPSFPLTVLSWAPDEPVVVNVWSRINRRSTYLLTSKPLSGAPVNAWHIRTLVANETVQPAETLAAIRTGNDTVVASVIRQRQDKKVCTAATTAVARAEETLKRDPKIDEHINRYRKNLKEDWDSTDPKIITRIDRGYSPVKTYKEDVGDHLTYIIRDVNRRIKDLKTYQHVNNSVCQLNQQRMDKLLSALEDYSKSLSQTQDQFDRTYYADAKAYTKKLQDFNDMRRRIQDQQQAAAWDGMLANSQASLNSAISSLNATVSNIQRQNNTIMQNALDARRLKAERERQAQFADFDTRRHAYFASDAPAVIEQKVSPGASGKTPATGARKPNRLSTHDALAQAQQKTDRIKQAEEKRAREKRVQEKQAQEEAALKRQRLEQEKRAREKRAQEKAARERIVHNVVLTWRSKSGRWFACGPVQCIQGEGENTEQEAIGYVLGEPRHTIVGSGRYYSCYQYATAAKLIETAGDLPEAKIRRNAKCQIGKIGNE